MSVMPAPKHVRRLNGAKGWLEVGVLAPGIVYQLAEGHASTEVARMLCLRLDELIERHGRIEIFDDWYGITSYDTEARREIERWTVRRRAAIERIHVLLSSKLVAMAISVSNLMNGGATIAYTEREKFEQALWARLGSVGPGT